MNTIMDEGTCDNIEIVEENGLWVVEEGGICHSKHQTKEEAHAACALILRQKKYLLRGCLDGGNCGGDDEDPHPPFLLLEGPTSEELLVNPYGANAIQIEIDGQWFLFPTSAKADAFAARHLNGDAPLKEVIGPKSQSSEVAVLILAYRYAAGLKELLRFFDAAEFDTFVHVDVKSNISEFVSAAAEAARPPQFLSSRINVFWRGFSMVEATICLLENAISRGKYKRFIIISDDSLPVVSPNTLKTSLLSKSNFMTAKIDTSFIKRYESFVMLDSAATQVRWLPIVDRIFTANDFVRLERMRLLMKRGKKPLKNYWHGSQWMSLTDLSVNLIMDSWRSDSWLKESFEFSEVPDESYFHTIISEVEPTVWRPLIHADWSAPQPPRVFRSINEISNVQTKGAMFVRKVDLTAFDLQQWVTSLLNQDQPKQLLASTAVARRNKIIAS